MSATTLSSKFQISIPKEIREEMHLKPGQKFVFLRRGRCLQLVPQATIDELFGIARGANPEGYRDRTDRLDRYPHLKRKKTAAK